MGVIAEARKILAEHPRSVRAWAVYREALRRIDAMGTRVGFDVQQALDGFDEEALREVIAEETGER
jgi:hypothetical protein